MPGPISSSFFTSVPRYVPSQLFSTLRDPDRKRYEHFCRSKLFGMTTVFKIEHITIQIFSGFSFHWWKLGHRIYLLRSQPTCLDRLHSPHDHFKATIFIFLHDLGSLSDHRASRFGTLVREKSREKNIKRYVEYHTRSIVEILR